MKHASRIAPISEFVERFSRRITVASPNRELTRFQWCALRYYARAYKKARTVQDFAVAHAIRRGRAVQIVCQLRRKRLLSCRSRAVEQAQGIKVTAAGSKLLRQDPQLLIRAALTSLSVSERRALLISLKRASAALTRSTKRATGLLFVAGANLLGHPPGKEQQTQNLAQSACELLSKIA